MSETCKLLFVYGTLLRSDSGATGREQRARLELDADWRGRARTAGLLYDLGRYPGLVVSAQPGAEVHGEIFELADPAHTLRWLDAYEGIVPGPVRSLTIGVISSATSERIAIWAPSYSSRAAAMTASMGG